MRLIVTGFGSFQGVSLNPTAQLIDFLRDKSLAVALGVEVDLRVLNVTAREADAFAASVAASSASSSPEPLLIVHLGVDASCRTPTIAIERCAYNECGFRCPDEAGVVLGRDHAPCPSASLGERLETGVDVERLKARMEARRDKRDDGDSQKRYQVRISEDAGRFLCNYIFARSLSVCRRQKAAGTGDGNGTRCDQNADALFVHVPPFSVLAEEVQREAVLDLLEALVEMMAGGGS
jgi:pyroglutamyl-peptidase